MSVFYRILRPSISLPQRPLFQFQRTRTFAQTVMSLGKTATLNTGAKIPLVGLGTWLSKPNEVEQAVEIALRAGYRHM
jgi:hypothetical protein